MGRHNLGRSSTTFVAPAVYGPVCQQQKTAKAWLVYSGLMDDGYPNSLPRYIITKVYIYDIQRFNNQGISQKFQLHIPCPKRNPILSNSHRLLCWIFPWPPPVRSPTSNAAEPTAIARPCLKARPEAARRWLRMDDPRRKHHGKTDPSDPVSSPWNGKQAFPFLKWSPFVGGHSFISGRRGITV